jgi:hypothetical protein
VRRLLFYDSVCYGDSAAFSESSVCFLSRLKHEEFGVAARTLLNLRSASFICLLTACVVELILQSESLAERIHTIPLLLFKAMLLLFFPVFTLHSKYSREESVKRNARFLLSKLAKVGLSDNLIAETVNLKSVNRIRCQPSPSCGLQTPNPSPEEKSVGVLAFSFAYLAQQCSVAVSAFYFRPPIRIKFFRRVGLWACMQHGGFIFLARNPMWEMLGE